MKRIITMMSLVFAASVLAAQGVESSWFKAQTSRYSVMSETSQSSADLTAKTMEAYFQVFNSYFHFDENALKTRLNIRLFATKEGFDAYLIRVLGQTRDDFVYLHYPTQEKCELLLFEKPTDEFQVSLAHQGFVQFLKAFVSSPPLWIREGFAVLFEQLRYDERTGIAVYRENLAWLETVKAYKADKQLFSAQDLLLMGQDKVRESIDLFYPESWMFVSFLVNTEQKLYNRLLWDTVAALKKDASLEENSLAASRLAEMWVGFDNLDTQFSAYMDTRKTFAELVNEGMSLYSEKKYDAAETIFAEANRLNDSNHVPYYYLGLIAYYKKDYIQAETFYRTSLQMGCEPGIANYALGINAYTNNRFEDAMAFLLAAKSSAPEKYGTKADELIQKLQ